MGTLTIDQIILQWKLEKITAEQAIGYILQNMAEMEKQQRTLSATLYGLSKQVDSTPKRAENSR
jgi:hypothetical protein